MRYVDLTSCHNIARTIADAVIKDDDDFVRAEITEEAAFASLFNGETVVAAQKAASVVFNSHVRDSVVVY